MMKKWLLLSIVFVMMLSLIVPTFAFDNSTCPTCDNYGWFTGKSKTDWGHLFYQYKCPNNHYWWERQN